MTPAEFVSISQSVACIANTGIGLFILMTMVRCLTSVEVRLRRIESLLAEPSDERDTII